MIKIKILRRFNILYVENFSEIIGGGQISLLGLLERLDKGLFNPIVVCPSSGSLPEAIKRLNIEVKIIALPGLKGLNIFGFVKSISEMRELITNNEIDLVHANGSRACIYAGITAKGKKTPLVWHVRIAERDLPLDIILAGLSTRIIAISGAVKKRFNWLKDIKDKVEIIYNGVELEKFDPTLSAETIRRGFGLKPGTPLVGTVARLDWYKGHKYLLLAARKVIDKIPECNFLIVGEGEKRKELVALASKLKLDNHVIFAGQRNDIPAILASLDLFVLPSVSEGLGRSIIEAMAMEKAVVATNAGGIPEVVKDRETGILVPVRNPIALAEAIIELLNNKDLAFKMGKAGRRLVESKFNLNINVEKIQKLYLSLLVNKISDNVASE